MLFIRNWILYFNHKWYALWFWSFKSFCQLCYISSTFIHVTATSLCCVCDLCEADFRFHFSCMHSAVVCFYKIIRSVFCCNGHVQPYKYHKLEADIATTLTVTKEDAVKYYTQMKTIRTMETAAGNLYKEKAVRGFCHLYSGQVCHVHLCADECPVFSPFIHSCLVHLLYTWHGMMTADAVLVFDFAVAKFTWLLQTLRW